MAKNDNLTDYLTDLADGIRAKKDTTDLINPQDFATEIERISGGGNGGSESEASSYYALQNVSEVVLKRLIIGYATYIKGTLSSGTRVVENACAFAMRDSNVHNYAEAVCIKWDEFFSNVSGSAMTARENLQTLVGASVEEIEEMLTRITKEQFYDLNA